MTGLSTAFFGRESELVELDQAVQARRVVTLCGPAGVGKTALLRRWIDDHPHRAIDLTEYDDDAPLEAFIAASLGVTLAADADEVTRRRALRAIIGDVGDQLCLDNAEHVATDVAELVDDPLFVDCRFVVASRERLRCGDEHCVHIDPFSLAGAEPEAVRYLGWRAAQLGGTHALRDDESDAAQALARRLDGLPLALDLAAARLNLLRPAQLLDRLETSADVLSTAGTRSLTDALAASWDAAPDEERRALAALGVLDGPFDPQLGEEVIGRDGLTLLQRLRDRSVVVVDPDGRVRLLLSVRDFVRTRTDELARREAIERLTAALASRVPRWLEAADRLEPLGVVDAMRSHARHLQLAVREGGMLPSSQWGCAVALAEVALLDGTAAQALDVVRRLPRTDRALRTAVARLASETGRLDEADELLADVHDFAALIERAHNAQLRGDLKHAAALVAQASQKSTNDIERGRAALTLAGVVYHRGEYEEAREHYESALRHARRAGDLRTEARALQNLGILHCDQMRLDLARKCLGDAIDRHRLSGDVLREAWAHNGLGVVSLRAGDSARGVAELERAGSLFDRVGHRVGAASTRANLAMIAVDNGEWDDGVRHSLDALDRATAEEDDYIAGMSKLCLTLSTWFSGDRDAAGRYFSDFEPTISRDAHIQLALSWDAARGAYLAAIGDPHAADVFDRAEQLLSDDDGHEIYRTMLELARCHELLRELRQPGRDRADVVVELLDVVTGADPARSEPLRFTIALLEHEALGDVAPLVRAAATATSDQLIVAPLAQAFRPPGGVWQALGRSPSLWSLFEALAVAARDDSGPLDLDDLQRATWPGETLTAESAANRLHVSLSKLRALGLKPFIVRRGEGYALDAPVAFICPSRT